MHIQSISTCATKRAVLHCCASRHAASRDLRRTYLSDVATQVRASIMYCDIKRDNPRFALAADRLRDWLTARTLTAELDAMEAARD